MIWENINKLRQVQRKMKDGRNEEREKFDRKTEKKKFRDMIVVHFC